MNDVARIARADVVEGLLRPEYLLEAKRAMRSGEMSWDQLREIESPADVAARIQDASKYVPLERLALSPQCGFASGEMAHTMTHLAQEAKLRLISQVARKVWG